MFQWLEEFFKSAFSNTFWGVTLLISFIVVAAEYLYFKKVHYKILENKVDTLKRDLKEKSNIIRGLNVEKGKLETKLTVKEKEINNLKIEVRTYEIKNAKEIEDSPAPGIKNYLNN